jgi:hypothetical protein
MIIQMPVQPNFWIWSTTYTSRVLTHWWVVRSVDERCWKYTWVWSKGCHNERVGEVILVGFCSSLEIKGDYKFYSFILAVVVIMTMCTTHGIFNAFVDKLFKYLLTTLLLQLNCLSTSYYHAKNTVRKMDLEYNIIYYCP